MAKNVWHNIENFNPLIVFNDANSPTKACHVKCAGKRGTKVGPLFQVNSDRSKNLNKFFLKVYFASKLIQSDIKFSNRWTRRLYSVEYKSPLKSLRWVGKVSMLTDRCQCLTYPLKVCFGKHKP